MLIFKNKHSLFLFSIILILLLSGCTSPDSGWTDERKSIMDVTAEIRVFHENRTMGKDAIDETFERLFEIEEIFYTRHVTSQISRINAAAGISSTSVTDEVRFLVEEGLAHHTMSNGLFHIGLGNVIELWGFDNNQPHMPDPDAIAVTLESADIESVQLTGNEIMIIERGMSLNLDELSKGYALDEAARVLQDFGIMRAQVIIGDDVYALGEKPGGDSWHVWIKKPYTKDYEMLGYLEVINLAVSTTGNDVPVSFSNDDAEVYHQLLHPLTGQLVSNDLASVTVVSDTGLDGSIYSTTAFIMGLDEGYKYLLEAPGVEGLFITQDNTIYTTPGLTGMFHLVDDENFTIEVMVMEEDRERDQ